MVADTRTEGNENVEVCYLVCVSAVCVEGSVRDNVKDDGEGGVHGQSK